MRRAAGGADGLAATQQNVAGEREGNRPPTEPTHKLTTWSVAVATVAKAKRKLGKRHSSPRGWQRGRSQAMLNSRNPPATPRGLTRSPRLPTPERRAT